MERRERVMKFSEMWLREWVDPDISTEALGRRLTMAGLEVDSMGPAAPPSTRIVVGRVTTVVPHPGADRLKLCQVDAGEGEPFQVVCGADNVVEGMCAPFAKLGAELPGNVKIRKAKLKGVESFGMLCSSKELGLTDSATGVMSLEESASPGDDIRDYLQLDDVIFELDLTPNRADCLSIAGIAREVSVLTGAPLKTRLIEAAAVMNDRRFNVHISAPQACPRYVGRVITGIDPRATTPLWMQERLRRGGIRSIGPVVDVTNYAMLELGQPLHAFDLAKLQGGIRVRLSDKGEKIALLDGQELVLEADTLVIADHAHPVALAGIMGGLDTAVSTATRNVFLESAFFNAPLISGKARAYGLHTDSSHRFERGVDPQLQGRAMERATNLLLDIVGGEPGPIVDVVSTDHLPVRPSIALRAQRITRVLGVSPEPGQVGRTLSALGCQTQPTKTGWRVRPPSFRFDLAIEADLIEEVGRIYGYDRIPASSQAYAPVIREQHEATIPLSRIRRVLVDRGYQEAVTFSFVEPNWEALFNPATEAKWLANPISNEMAVMRTTLWPGLVKAAQHNLNRQQTRLKLFETGLCFREGQTELAQTPTLSALVTGTVLPEQWGVTIRPVDFFDIKGDVEALLTLSGLLEKVEFRPARHPALHPGQSCELYHEGKSFGWLGALHPRIERALDVGQKIYLFEMVLAVIRQRRVPRFEPLSKFPAIRRDLAIVIEQNITAHQVKVCVVAENIPELRECNVFDVYRGKGVAPGQKSLALGLILQDLSRTLKDIEVDAIVSHVVSTLAHALGASLRE
jgi:phenylalanyl-tRNA synthetase beta chain